MTKQHEALRLAHAIDPGDEGSKTVLTIDVSNAAKELRRLHEVNVGLLGMFKEFKEFQAASKADDYGFDGASWLERMDTAITKATGETE